MHNVELFNYKQAPKHWDSYYKMSMPYYFQLLIQKHEIIYPFTIIYTILKYKHHNINTVIIQQ